MRGMTLASVAGQLNLAAPAVIYYFGNKEKLVAEIFLKAIAHYDALLDKAESAKTSAGKIRELINGCFEWERRVAMGEVAPIAIFNDVRALNNSDVNAAFVALFRRVRGLLPAAPDLSSTDRISARINLTKGAFYHYNQSKSDLVVACFQRTIDAVWRALDQAEAAGAGLRKLASTCAALAEHQFQGDAPLLSTTALSTLPEQLRAGVTEKPDVVPIFVRLIFEGIGAKPAANAAN